MTNYSKTMAESLMEVRKIEEATMKDSQIAQLKMEFWESLEEHKGDKPHDHPHDEDELDEDNMDGFVRILELVKVYFKNVLLVSHLDSLKDSVDMQIVIDKKDGFAYVSQ